MNWQWHVALGVHCRNAQKSDDPVYISETHCVFSAEWHSYADCIDEAFVTFDVVNKNLEGSHKSPLGDITKVCSPRTQWVHRRKAHAFSGNGSSFRVCLGTEEQENESPVKRHLCPAGFAAVVTTVNRNHTGRSKHQLPPPSDK